MLKEIGMITLGITLGLGYMYLMNKPEPKVITKTVVVKSKPKSLHSPSPKPLVAITVNTLKNDIKRYKATSGDVKNQILDSIVKYAKIYKLNPLIVYVVIASESSFEFWRKHNLTTVTIEKSAKVKKHKIKVRAIGLGGIVWEIWRDKLIKNNIALLKSDLFLIPNNIEATCYILKYNMTLPLLNGTKTKQESAFLRYFGGGKKNLWYVDRINRAISKLVQSELYK